MALALMVILLLTALGWWLSRSTPLGQQLGMTLVVLMLGLLVTNITGWKPDQQAAGWISGPLTSLAIVQLLLAIDLRSVWPDARRLLVPFVASVLLTLTAVLLSGLVLAPWLGEQLSVFLRCSLPGSRAAASILFLSLAHWSRRNHCC